MRLAESVRAHWFLALTSVAFVGSTVAVLAMCPEKETKIISVEKSKSPRIGKCGGAKSRKLAPAHVEAKTDGATYRDALLVAQPALQRCMDRFAGHDVAYRVSVNVGPNGRVVDVEVKAESQNLADVNLHAVACIEKAISPLAFPRSEGTKRVSTRLTHDK